VREHSKGDKGSFSVEEFERMVKEEMKRMME